MEGKHLILLPGLIFYFINSLKGVNGCRYLIGTEKHGWLQVSICFLFKEILPA
jgi:hypothetical protein